MAYKKEVVRPVCPSCGRKTIYYRTDGSVRCTACGHDSKREK